jgi:hypothetical protein
MGQSIANSKSECVDSETEDVIGWDKYEVQVFLKEKKYPDQLVDNFFRRGLTGKELLSLNMEKMIELGVPIELVRELETDIYQLMIHGNRRRMLKNEEQAVQIVLNKLNRLKSSNNKDLETIMLLAECLSLKNYMLRSYLNTEVIALRATLKSLMKSSSGERNRSNMFDSQSRNEMDLEVKELEMIGNEYQSFMNYVETSAPKSSKNVIEYEPVLNVKLVIVEVPKQKTLRRILSPIMSTFDLTPKFGLFHTALIIGRWYLEWNDSSLVIPRRCFSNAAVFAADISKTFRGIELNDALEKMAEFICEWNTSYEYSSTSRNCQTFVDELCRKLGIDLSFTGSLANYINQCRTTGNGDLKFPLTEELKRVLKTDADYAKFNTHIELDKFVDKINDIYPTYFDQHPDDRLLLKSFDRAFWLRYFNEKNNNDCKPEEVNESNFYSSCPFQHPYQTCSIMKDALL